LPKLRPLLPIFDEACVERLQAAAAAFFDLTIAFNVARNLNIANGAKRS
jgi:hypothetical protein